MAQRIERASASIARLDARVAVSPVANAWRQRAAWSGYAASLRGQSTEIEEIDIFARECGVSIPGRISPPSMSDDAGDLTRWQADLRDHSVHHWRDDVAYSTATPDDWRNRPALLRALEMLGRHARANRSIASWLNLPRLLHSMEVTATPLPCLAIADKALRLTPRDGEAIVARFLRQIAKAAVTGLQRLDAMEEHRLLAATVAGNIVRPGKLLPLLALLQLRPVTSPRVVARQLELSISGAGKLLARAADAGLLVEISGRQAWKTYLVTDLAVAFGFARRSVGRPLKPPKVSEALDPSLSRFDVEMAELDAMLARLGVGSDVGDGDGVDQT
ncbi:hypothetical protein [Sphingomonas solaris]|nr:hypothetical protein [Sphingomonas solaris]